MPPFLFASENQKTTISNINWSYMTSSSSDLTLRKDVNLLAECVQMTEMYICCHDLGDVTVQNIDPLLALRKICRTRYRSNISLALFIAPPCVQSAPHCNACLSKYRQPVEILGSVIWRNKLHLAPSASSSASVAWHHLSHLALWSTFA